MITSSAPTIKTAKTAITLSEVDRVILIDLTSDFNVNLMAVDKVAGLIVSVRVINYVATNTVTVTTAGAEKIEVPNSIPVDTVTLDALGEYTLLYSDGVKWYELVGNR